MSADSAEPAWLTAVVDQRLALMKDTIGVDTVVRDGRTVMMTPLTEPPEGASQDEQDAWEFTCDNCGRYCPESMWMAHTERSAFGVQVLFMFGVCPPCAAEFPNPPPTSQENSEA